MELKERKSLCKADRGKYRYTEVFYRGCIDILFLSDIVVIVHFSYRFFWLDSFRASSYIIERKVTRLLGNGQDLYRSLCSKLFVSLVYRPVTNTVNIRNGTKTRISDAVKRLIR
jgi:hypothetical protein